LRNRNGRVGAAPRRVEGDRGRARDGPAARGRAGLRALGRVGEAERALAEPAAARQALEPRAAPAALRTRQLRLRLRLRLLRCEEGGEPPAQPRGDGRDGLDERALREVLDRLRLRLCARQPPGLRAAAARARVALGQAARAEPRRAGAPRGRADLVRLRLAAERHEGARRRARVRPRRLRRVPGGGEGAGEPRGRAARTPFGGLGRALAPARLRRARRAVRRGARRALAVGARARP
jgi:hypothetical protein